MSRIWIAIALLLPTPLTVVGQETHAISPPVSRPMSDTPDSPVTRRSAVQTAPERSLSLADLERIAFQSNPTLATAAARMNAARGHQIQAGLYPNPVAGYHATQVGNNGTTGQQGGFVSQRFITGGKLQLDQAIAGKEIDEAHFRIHAQEQRILSDVRIRFYDALVAQRRIAMTTELARIGDDAVDATQQLIKGRQGTENDLLQAEIRADESHILLDNAVNEQLEAWRRLMAVVGNSQLNATSLEGRLDTELPTFDWDSCYSSVLKNNPTLIAAQMRAQRMQISIQRARQEPIPNIDVLVSLRHNNIVKNGSEVANIQLGFPVPMFNKNQGNIRTAEAEWVAACHEVKRIELNLQDRLAVAWRRYANASQQTQRYKERMVPRAKRSLQLVTDGYKQGQVEYLTLLTAQQTYLQVNLSYLDSLKELRSASSTIEGQLLTDSLAVR